VPLVLAIEPDPRQAATLKRVVKGQVRAELVLVDSKDAALATIATRVPDLILVTALLPPRDEDDLTRHLKALDHAAHLQTLTIPLLGSAPVEEHLGSRMFGAFRSKRRPAPIDGCDPKMFGEQIEAYLQRAAELRAEEHARELTRRENADADQSPFASALADIDQSPFGPALGDADQSPVGQGFSPVNASLAEQIADTTIAEQDVVPANAAIVAQGFSPALADTDQSPFGPALGDVDQSPAGQGFSPANASPAEQIADTAITEQDFNLAVADIAGAAPIAQQREPDPGAPLATGPIEDIGEPMKPDPPSLARNTSAAVHAVLARALAPLHAFIARIATNQKAGASAVARDAKTTASILASRVTTGAASSASDTTGSSADAEEGWHDLTPLIAPAVNPPAAGDPGEQATGLKTGGSTATGPETGGPTAEKKARRRRRRRTAPPVPELETPITSFDGHWIASAIAALRVDIERLRQDALTGATTAAGGAHEAYAENVPSQARSGNGAGDGNGNGNGQNHAQDPRPEESESVQDEWGFYDPGRCGMQALMARLEAQNAAGRDQAAGGKTSAMQKLIGSHRDAAPARPPAPPAESADDKRLAPLAMWARASEGSEYDVEQILPADSTAHLPGLAAGLRLPDHVAAVRYASGCRIRRVRVAPGPKQVSGDKRDKRQVVILSRKALKETR
jgi:hypothetical protein